MTLPETVQLQSICDQIAEEIDAIVSIFAGEGEIICCSKRSRIGTFHEGVAKILSGEINRYEATAEIAAQNPGFLEGAALPIDVDGKRELCVSVSAPVDVARVFCRLVQHWIIAITREQALVESQERFRDVAESAGDWIWEMDAGLRFSYLSPRFYEITRFSPESIIGKTRGEMASVDKNSKAWTDHLATLEAHLPFRDFSFTIKIGTGELRHVRISGKPVRDGEGEFTGYRGTGYDVTEQVELEQALQRSQRLLVDSLEAIPEAFSLFDSNDRLVVFNRKYQSFLLEDVGVEASPGMTFENIIRIASQRGRIPEAQGRQEEWISERMARHRKLSEPHIQQRGAGRWYLVSEHRTTDGGTVAIYSDVTEIKQRELELAEKSQAMELLSGQLAKYLSPQIYDSIFSGQQETGLVSRRKKLTVFFSDIVGFTEMTDRMESEELTHLLNHYLTEMSEIALQYGATIDKYVGDAIVIFFGDPETRGVKEDALQCARMALAMQSRMLDLQKSWRDAGISKPLQCRMGISTGYCTVGNFGSENRMDYTIIGNGVNLASRLERACEPGDILIPYETYALIKDEFDCAGRGDIEVRGMAHPVATYSVLGMRQSDSEDASPDLLEVSNFILEFDPEGMSPQQRAEAVERLSKAIETLSGGTR